MVSGIPTGPRGGTHYPNPELPSIPRNARWIITYALNVRFLNQLYSRAAMGVLCPHVGGTVAHQARDLMYVFGYESSRHILI